MFSTSKNGALILFFKKKKKKNLKNLKKLQSIVNIFVFFIKTRIKGKSSPFLNNLPFSPTPFLEKIFYPHSYCQIRGSCSPPSFIKYNLYNIVSVLEAKGKACSIFLDFAKGFDAVNHDILLSKLKY